MDTCDCMVGCHSGARAKRVNPESRDASNAPRMALDSGFARYAGAPE